MFYHPAAWWINATIRAERENCCDDLAVAMQGDALVYAAALTALETKRGAMRHAVLAATGGSLLKRIRRILTQTEAPRATLTPILSAALLTVTAAAALSAWQTAPPHRRRLRRPRRSPASNFRRHHHLLLRRLQSAKSDGRRRRRLPRRHRLPQRG